MTTCSTRLGRFLVAQTEPSGAVLASYDTGTGEPVPGEYSKYYTGEAYWALARLDRAFPGEGWGRVADRIGTYLATRRDEAEDHWPPIPDHWAAYGMAERVGGGVAPSAATRWTTRAGRPSCSGRRRAGWRSATGRGARSCGPGYEPRGGWYGVIGEALTGWWRVAGHDARLAEVRDAISERATCVAGLAVSAQSSAEEAAGAARPGRVEGAWFRDGDDADGRPAARALRAAPNDPDRPGRNRARSRRRPAVRPPVGGRR